MEEKNDEAVVEATETTTPVESAPVQSAPTSEPAEVVTETPTPVEATPVEEKPAPAAPLTPAEKAAEIVRLKKRIKAHKREIITLKPQVANQAVGAKQRMKKLEAETAKFEKELSELQN